MSRTVRRTLGTTLVVAAAASFGACGPKEENKADSGYANDGATGAASPATQPTPGMTPMSGASTDAVAEPAGGGGPAGIKTTQTTGATTGVRAGGASNPRP